MARERRKHIRRAVFDRCVLIKKTTPEIIVSNFENVSAGGLGVLSPVKLDVDESVICKFAVPFEKKNPVIEAYAKIVWEKDTGSREDRYLYGLRFLNLSPAGRALIKEYIKYNSAPEAAM